MIEFRNEGWAYKWGSLIVYLLLPFKQHTNTTIAFPQIFGANLLIVFSLNYTTFGASTVEQSESRRAEKRGE